MGEESWLISGGIPRTENEDTRKLVLELAKIMEVETTESDNDLSHRTSNKSEAGIIVKFQSRFKRDIFYEGRRKLKNVTISHLGFTGDNKIFINESLTAMNGDLFKSTREQFLNSKIAKYVWTKNGQVFIRHTDSSKKINIKSKEDIATNAAKLC